MESSVLWSPCCVYLVLSFSVRKGFTMHRHTLVLILQKSIKCSVLTAFLGMTTFVQAADPDCEGGFFSLCSYFGSTVTEVPGTEEIITTGPDLGLIWNTVWAACPSAGNCCGSNVCTLSWSTTNVTSGLYSVDTGGTLGIPISRSIPTTWLQ